MGYSENKKAYNIEYAKNKFKRVPLDLQKEYYENILLPAVQASGETVNGFIKKAIQERIDKQQI